MSGERRLQQLRLLDVVKTYSSQEGEKNLLHLGRKGCLILKLKYMGFDEDATYSRLNQTKRQTIVSLVDSSMKNSIYTLLVLV